MKKINPHGIAIKLGVVLAVVILIIILCIEGILYSLFIRFYTDDSINEQIKRTNNYAAILSDHFDENTIRHVILMEEDTGNLLLIMDEAKSVLNQSSGIDTLDSFYVNESKSHDTINHGPVLASDWKNEPYFITWASIKIQDGGGDGQIIMYGSTEPIQEAVKTLRNTFSAVSFASILMGIAVIIVITGKIVNPLLKMIKIAHSISEGKYNHKLDSRGKDEIGQLAAAINRMSSSIKYYKQQRNQFLADISHELKTPLTYMKGYSEVLLQDLSNDEDKRHQYLKLIHSQSIHLQRLVQDLLDLAQLEQQHFALAFQKTSLDKVIMNVLAFMQLPLKEKGIQLNYFPSQEPMFINGDDKRLQQVLINLLENGKNYTAADGTITIEVNRSDENGKVVITDTGIGIPEDEIPLIWDRLYRVEKSRSRVSGGSGLGLAICKEIIELHGGTITARSQVGKWTAFEIHLPLLEINEN
ncbi:hypothetical protein BK120_30105 [Paenibacillus sp. FSL A5-0031]|uniref:HAMP domain-containing sensor histidine kinase n=1 Tax=Paenibacillus sp. FSL A5-0031 TaxID=1920420 RepID=UPI00096F555D|nr:HAMP domain-containing sensor histidine kinase [Paenibacillus sp. FSL A5-0031]OME75920.1 hypothetical protein BK120_30105 [Paenibacillus sp. FSL A5-0031]